MKTNVPLANELRQLSDAMLKMAKRLDPPQKSTVDVLSVVHSIHKAIMEQKVGFRNGWVSASAVRALVAPAKIGPQQFGEIMQSLGFVHSYRINTTGQERDRFPDAGDKTRIYTNTERNWRPCVIAAEYDAAQRTVDDPRAEL